MVKILRENHLIRQANQVIHSWYLPIILGKMSLSTRKVGIKRFDLFGAWICVEYEEGIAQT